MPLQPALLHALITATVLASTSIATPTSAQERDLFGCRAKIRASLGIAPYTGPLYPGFGKMVTNCIARAMGREPVASRPARHASRDDRGSHRQKSAHAGGRRHPNRPVSAPQEDRGPGPTERPPEKQAQPVQVAATPTPQQPSAPDPQIKEGLQDLRRQVDLLRRMLKEQEARRVTNTAAPSSAQTTRAIEDRIEHLRKQAPAERPTAYATAIRSTEGETGETAHKAAEVYARIPFYIPGTNEIGEFYVEPRVTDKGEMTFQFRFTDPDSAAEKIRLQVDLSPAEIAEIQTGLVRVQRWSDTAHRNKLRKFFEKRAACVPAADCPPDGATLNDRSSTEIRFQVTDEGITSGVFQRNKGRYAERYNFSVESGLLLSAYIQHVSARAKLDYQAGTQTKEDLNRIFE